MRSSITLFEDQYQFFKELKSKRLLVAFVEYMFEDIEPTGLSGIEKTVFNSLRNRMENSKNLHDGNSRGGKQSHGGGRRGNASSDLDQKNKSKTTRQTSQKQLKNNEEEVEEEVYKENKKKKGYGEFKKCLLTEDEYKQVLNDYGTRNGELLISNVDNYCASNGKKYKNYVATIRNFAKSSGIEKQSTESRNESGIYDLPF